MPRAERGRAAPGGRTDAMSALTRLVAIAVAAGTLALACLQIALAQPRVCPSYDDDNRAEQRCVTHHEHGEAH